jgi:negative regulator of flagellin synthesis FlgM
MSNPIDNGPRISGSAVGGTSRSQQSQAGKSTASAATTTAGQADAASESERLQQVRERIDNTPEVDMERVEQIKQAIAEGRFPVDAQRIAAKFAELEGMLNG